MNRPRALRPAAWALALLLSLASLTVGEAPLHAWGQAPGSNGQSPAVVPGVDVLLANPVLLKGKRIGLVTHNAGLTADGRRTAEALARTPGLQLTALFAPEHGLNGDYDAGEPVPNISSRTPVYSLFGAVFQPTGPMLSRVDVLVVDLQDVGVRPFTYTSTMANVMLAAKRVGKPVVILDRPNPLGGVTVDGPVLEPELRSFIGPQPIPYVFGMTIGELAQLFNKAFGIGADLTVVPMRGWTRKMTWADTGLPWENPSPGITYPEAPFYYAATGPVEGTNVWNGVATESRFQVVLAEWIDGPALAERLNRYTLPGVQFTPSAIPYVHTGRVWQGVRFHITDPATFRPSTTIIYVLAEIRRLYPEQFAFRQPRRGPHLFDLVWGTKTVRLALSRGDPAPAIVAQWQPALERFQKLREPYLLYR
jgi:uncharacterized protein YbbC (DUF1343 family)